MSFLLTSNCTLAELFSSSPTATHFEPAYNQGGGFTCFRLAQVRFKKSAATATPSFEKTCTLDYAPGCILFGAMQIAGIGVRQDVAAGKELLGKACRLNEAYCELFESVRNTPVPSVTSAPEPSLR